jgi:hypothetical protein
VAFYYVDKYDTLKIENLKRYYKFSGSNLGIRIVSPKINEKNVINE